MRKVVTAVANAPTATPASNMVVTGVVLPTRAAITTTPTVSTPPTNAASGTVLMPMAVASSPPAIARVAPRPAPDATPTR